MQPSLEHHSLTVMLLLTNSCGQMEPSIVELMQEEQGDPSLLLMVVLQLHKLWPPPQLAVLPLPLVPTPVLVSTPLPLVQKQVTLSLFLHHQHSGTTSTTIQLLTSSLALTFSSLPLTLSLSLLTLPLQPVPSQPSFLVPLLLVTLPLPHSPYLVRQSSVMHRQQDSLQTISIPQMQPLEVLLLQT